MATVISNAGLAPKTSAKPSRRGEVIKTIRAIIRNPQASDEDVDDALDTLIELSKHEE